MSLDLLMAWIRDYFVAHRITPPPPPNFEKFEGLLDRSREFRLVPGLSAAWARAMASIKSELMAWADEATQHFIVQVAKVIGDILIVGGLIGGLFWVPLTLGFAVWWRRSMAHEPK
jgi:hypothetical protein